jgi:hypothetical protein
MAARCRPRQVLRRIRVSSENYSFWTQRGLPERNPKLILDMRSSSQTYIDYPESRILNWGSGIGFLRGLIVTIVILTASLVTVLSADPADVAFQTGEHDRAL